MTRGGDRAEHERPRIDPHRALPVLGGQLEHRSLHRLHRAGDEHVEAAERVGGLVDEAGRVLADVAAHEHGAAPQLGDRGGGRLRGVVTLAVADRHVGAAGRHRERDRPRDPAAGARHVRAGAARPAHGMGTGSPVTARRPLTIGVASWLSASRSVLRSELTSRSSGRVPPTV